MHISSIISTCIAVATFVIFLCGCSGQPAEENQFSQDLVAQNTALQQQINQLKFRLDSLQNLPEMQASAQPNTLLSDTELNYLKKRGLQDPVNQIKISLLQNNQLIPVEGTLGGTMRFYQERIYVLNRKWVLAYFEDGHMAGQMLLEYKIGTGGKLAWHVITSAMM